MKRALVLALALCLLVPAGAGAKGGVIFDRYPDVQAVGSQMRFTVMLFNRRDVRPLVTFRNSKTGEIVRTRASRSDLNGIAYGKVALPSTGPWATTISVNGRPILEGDAEELFGLDVHPSIAGGRMFDHQMKAFERVWETAHAMDGSST